MCIFGFGMIWGQVGSAMLILWCDIATSGRQTCIRFARRSSCSQPPFDMKIRVPHEHFTCNDVILYATDIFCWFWLTSQQLRPVHPFSQVTLAPGKRSDSQCLPGAPIGPVPQLDPTEAADRGPPFRRLHQQKVGVQLVQNVLRQKSASMISMSVVSLLANAD